MLHTNSRTDSLTLHLLCWVRYHVGYEYPAFSRALSPHLHIKYNSLNIWYNLYKYIHTYTYSALPSQLKPIPLLCIADGIWPLSPLRRKPGRKRLRSSTYVHDVSAYACGCVSNNVFQIIVTIVIITLVFDFSPTIISANFHSMVLRLGILLILSTQAAEKFLQMICYAVMHYSTQNFPVHLLHLLHLLLLLLLLLLLVLVVCPEGQVKTKAPNMKTTKDLWPSEKIDDVHI